jgi:hypothetical protein
MEIHNPMYIFQLPTLCKYGINCTNNNCNYTHPLGKYSQQNNKYDYYLGKQNILFKTYNIMKNKYNNQITLQCFSNNFYNYNFEQLLETKYYGLNHNIVPNPYFLMKNALVINHGAERLGGGVLSKGFVQEEIKTMVSTLLGAFIACHGWKNLVSPMKNSLINEPFIVRMEQFADITTLYGTTGILSAVDPNVVEQNIKSLNEPVQFDWLCMAFQKLKYTDGREYSYELLIQMFITTYKAFTVGIQNAIGDNNGEINILIGNIGCGAFNHCVNVTYSIVILGLYCAITQIGKNANIYYCTYDQEIYKELHSDLGAVNFMNSCKDRFSVKDIIIKILDKIKKNNKWREKFVY